MEIILFLGVIVLIIWGEWQIGKVVGKSVSKGTGLILGIILILIGFTLPAGVSVIMYSNKNKSDGPPLDLPAANFNLNVNKSDSLSSEQKNSKGFSEFVGKNYKDILSENNLSDYIDLFEKNKLTDISIISALSEADLEKLGISIMGDRKLIMKIFSVS